MNFFSNFLKSKKYLNILNLYKKSFTKDFVLKIVSKYSKNRTLNNLLGQSLLALNFHKEGLSYIRKGAGFLQLDENGVNLLK